MTPALQAEAQRARSEVEAALTIAAARPRDEKECVDRILVACQRPGVAESAEYEYSRGGTPIVGATIKLLEVVAQKYGNIEFGFRELARFPGSNGQPGESVVEAFAWDLESNTRRKAQFTVQHAIGLKGGRTKVLTDPRDIYETLANQAMRRVRTCLENVIPRDIVDLAREECRKTLATNEAITPQKIAAVVKAFAEYKVSKAMIEGKLQRHIDSITPAQMVQLRRIYTSLRDGMGEVSDWFDVSADEPQKSAAEAAKEQLRKAAAKQVQPPPPQTTEQPKPTVTPPQANTPQPDDDLLMADYQSQLTGAATVADVDALEAHAAKNDGLSATGKQAVLTACAAKREALAKPKRNPRGRGLLEGEQP